MGAGLAIAGGVAGGVLSGLANAAGSIYATERNIQNANYQAKLSRDFEKEMASTQYQRAIEDMKNAGINLGSIGASLDSNSVPSAAAATGSYAQAPHFENMFSSAVAAAMASDKNVTRKITQEMRDETALQVQNLRNQGYLQNEVQKKALKHASYRPYKSSSYSSAKDSLNEKWNDYKVDFESL